MAERKAEFEAEVRELGLEPEISEIKHSIELITSVFGKPAGVNIEAEGGRILWPR